MNLNWEMDVNDSVRENPIMSLCIVYGVCQILREGQGGKDHFNVTHSIILHIHYTYSRIDVSLCSKQIRLTTKTTIPKSIQPTHPIHTYINIYVCGHELITGLYCGKMEYTTLTRRTASRFRQFN